MHAVGKGQALADGGVAAQGDDPHRRFEARDHPRRGAGPRGHEHGGARHRLQRVLHHRRDRLGRRGRLAAGRTSPADRSAAWAGGAPRCRRRSSPASPPLPPGYLPIADSPESMMQSVPSRMALATSVASARVGRRLVTMDSSICVAVMTGLPARLALAMSCFWMMAISSIGTSTPRSPRATMMPSAAFRISSKCSSASARSILAMMKGCLPMACAAARTASMSAARLHERLAHRVHAMRRARIPGRRGRGR